MASSLYKIKGLGIVNVVDPPPINNNVPTLPPANTAVTSPNIPSPVIPTYTSLSFKPLKDLSIPRPKPDGSAKADKEEDSIYVFFPANPLIVGSADKWVPFTKVQYEQLVQTGVIVP